MSRLNGRVKRLTRKVADLAPVLPMLGFTQRSDGNYSGGRQPGRIWTREEIDDLSVSGKIRLLLFRWADDDDDGDHDALRITWGDEYE